MKDIMYYTMVIIIFLVVIIGFATLAIKIAKGPKKLFLGTKYLGVKKVSISFKLFNTYIGRNFLVQRNQTYEVVYKLETEQGKLSMSLDNQLFEETRSCSEGSRLMTFNTGRPVVKLVGTDAKNGRAEVKLIKH
ncbi:hypothetical protein [Lederbergia lenta]|uniref:hypothetical protein n=1 Tax=Lederbergia lenta TaxID=1467 RepID=UPI0020405DC7|nr:hypothetical protein [Lederbergia lenta]MCM3113159.1 hypothetical protein [Lederbergia lenta]